MLIEIGKLAGKKAAEENFSLGIPVIIEENGYIIELNKDGKKKRLQKITKSISTNGS